MPFIRIDHSLTLSENERRAITTTVTETYADEMDTTTGHVAVVLCRHDRSEMALGRAIEDRPVVLVNADVRAGRPFDHRRSFALAVMGYFRREWSVPRENLKIVFTEHPGNDMMGVDRVGGEWSPDE